MRRSERIVAEARRCDWVEQCLDATRRSENDFYDDPKDIDHGDEDKWGVCYKQAK